MLNKAQGSAHPAGLPDELQASASASSQSPQSASITSSSGLPVRPGSSSPVSPPSPPSTKLVDPTTQQTSPVFPLSVNELASLLQYKDNAGGDTPELSNSVVSKVTLPASAHFCFVTSHRPIPASTWSSIQTGERSHAEFDSALIYANHSCIPTLELHIFEPDAKTGKYIESCMRPSDEQENDDDEQTSDGKTEGEIVTGGPHGIAGEFRVSRNRDLKIGDDLTWFYPSTEFLSPRPFRCMCGADENVCIGWQRGARFLSPQQAARQFLNPHIVKLRQSMNWGDGGRSDPVIDWEKA